MRPEKTGRTRGSRKREPDPLPEAPAAPPGDVDAVPEPVPESPAAPPEGDAAAEPESGGLFRRHRPPSPTF